MDRGEKLCQKGRRWQTSLSRLQLLCPWTLYGSPLEQSWVLWGGSPLPCSRYRVSWERKAGNVHLTCRMTTGRTPPPTVGTLRFPVLLPPQETSGRWHCALSQRSHCCVPSGTPPSQLWTCQADQRHSRNNHPSEGWQLSNRKTERRKREWVPNHWSFHCFRRVHDLPWCAWLPHTPLRRFKATSLSKWRHCSYRALRNHQLVLVWCSPLSINSHQSPSSEELWGLGLLAMGFPHRRTNTRPAPTNPADPLWAQLPGFKGCWSIVNGSLAKVGTIHMHNYGEVSIHTFGGHPHPSKWSIFHALIICLINASTAQFGLWWTCILVCHWCPWQKTEICLHLSS